jgi:hypothetical protein
MQAAGSYASAQPMGAAFNHPASAAFHARYIPAKRYDGSQQASFAMNQGRPADGPVTQRLLLFIFLICAMTPVQTMLLGTGPVRPDERPEMRRVHISDSASRRHIERPRAARKEAVHPFHPVGGSKRIVGQALGAGNIFFQEGMRMVSCPEGIEVEPLHLPQGILPRLNGQALLKEEAHDRLDTPHG